MDDRLAIRLPSLRVEVGHLPDTELLAEERRLELQRTLRQIAENLAELRRIRERIHAER